jgi:hypothetical protein
MHPGEHPTSLADIAAHQGHLLMAGRAVQIADRAQLAMHGGQPGVHYALDDRPPRNVQNDVMF